MDRQDWIRDDTPHLDLQVSQNSHSGVGKESSFTAVECRMCKYVVVSVVATVEFTTMNLIYSFNSSRLDRTRCASIGPQLGDTPLKLLRSCQSFLSVHRLCQSVATGKITIVDCDDSKIQLLASSASLW